MISLRFFMSIEVRELVYYYKIYKNACCLWVDYCKGLVYLNKVKEVRLTIALFFYITKK